MTRTLKEIFEKSSLSDDIIKACRILYLWPKAAEGEIAKHTEALKLEKGILWVEVDNSTWAQEMVFLKEQLKNKVNGLAGTSAIKEIRFKVKEKQA